MEASIINTYGLAAENISDMGPASHAIKRAVSDIHIAKPPRVELTVVCATSNQNCAVKLEHLESVVLNLLADSSVIGLVIGKVPREVIK